MYLLDRAFCEGLAFYKISVCQLYDLGLIFQKVKTDLAPFAVVVCPIRVDCGGDFFILLLLRNQPQLQNMKDLMPDHMVHHLFQRPLIRALRTAGPAALEQNGEIFKADTLSQIVDASTGHADCVALLQQRLFPEAELFKSLLYPLGLYPAPEDSGVIPMIVMTDVERAFMEIPVGVSFGTWVEIFSAAIFDRRGQVRLSGLLAAMLSLGKGFDGLPCILTMLPDKTYLFSCGEKLLKNESLKTAFSLVKMTKGKM